MLPRLWYQFGPNTIPYFPQMGVLTYPQIPAWLTVALVSVMATRWNVLQDGYVFIYSVSQKKNPP